MTRTRKVPRPPERLVDFAQQLRREQVDAEALLWHRLRARRLGGFKFRRQYPVSPYVLDFYCAAAKVAVELDGSQHAERPQRDEARDAFLAAKGIRVLRFWNEQVFKQTEDVLGAIWLALQER